MGIFENFPYTNFHDLNLDWILRTMKDLDKEVREYIQNNKIQFADPIVWNIQSQYPANTLVTDPENNIVYLSRQAVPTGIALANTDYWQAVFTLQALWDAVDNVMESVAPINQHSSSQAEQQMEVNELFWLNHDLYIVTAQILRGQQIGSGNSRRVTIEEMLLQAQSYLTQKINTNTTNIEALQESQKQQDTRIDNIVSQAGTDNTEIVDARIAAAKLGSTVYTNLGMAIREQIKAAMTWDKINPSTDLNTLTNPNQYYMYDSEAPDPANLPSGETAQNGFIFIVNMGFIYPQPSSNKEFINQFLINNYGRVYIRQYINNSWSQWDDTLSAHTEFTAHKITENDQLTITDANTLLNSGIYNFNLSDASAVANLPEGFTQGSLIVVKPISRNSTNLKYYLTTQIAIGNSVYYRVHLLNDDWQSWTNLLDFRQYLNSKPVAVESTNWSRVLPDLNNVFDTVMYEFNFPTPFTPGTNAPANTPDNSSGNATFICFHVTPPRSIASYANYLTTQLYICEAGIYYRIYATTTIGWNPWIRVHSEQHITATPDTLLDVIDSNQGNAIYLQPGDYNLETMFSKKYGSDFWTNYTGYITAGEKEAGIVLHCGTQLIGDGSNVNIIFNYTGNNTHVIEEFSPINMTSGCKVSNIHITTSNCRYHIHDDFGGWWGQTAPGTNEIDHCVFDGDNNNHTAIGGGMYLTNNYSIHDCLFLQTDNTFIDISYHNHISDGKNKVYIKDNYGSGVIIMKPSGSTTDITPAIITNNHCHDIQLTKVDESSADNIIIYDWNNDKV